MSRYDPLRDWLAQCHSDSVVLTFQQVEDILGRTLPPSAFQYEAWWANIGDRMASGHSHARSWHAAGYRARVNRTARTVRFDRIDRDADMLKVPLAGISESTALPTCTVKPEAPPASCGDCVALISCSKLKRQYPCAAHELYAASKLFELSYQYARQRANRIYILSAKYGLVGEDAVIAPYDETLSDKTVAERQAWARGVLEHLKQTCDLQRDRFLLLAGRHYYEYLLPHLPNASLPLGNLTLGQRISYLQRQVSASASPAKRPRQLEQGLPITGADTANALHKLFERLPRYDWQHIDDIPFKNGIYIVYERGETYLGHERVVRVGTHTSQDRLIQRLKDHFTRENHNGSIFRKNIGKALLNRSHDPYLTVWSMDTSKPPHLGRADEVVEAQIERRVSEYMRRNLTFSVFPVPSRDERLRLEEAIIATLHHTPDFTPSSGWLGLDSPEEEIHTSGLWLKQGLDAAPLTDAEKTHLSQFVAETTRTAFAPGALATLNPGDHIRHDAFGEGTVLSVMPLLHDARLEVEFNGCGRKLLLLQVAQAHISILEKT